MFNLIKKEISLCLHPTVLIFLAFVVLLFVPNYPYEVIFFFSGMSVFLYCLSSRENGDLAFSCTLPVKKEYIPLARILTVIAVQCVLLLLSAITGAIKSVVLSEEMQLNAVGLSANIALVGNGALLLGIFNIIFFPLYYRSPDKVGVPFVIGAAVQFVIIGIFIILRYTTPLFAYTLNGSNAVNIGAKSIALLVGLAVYAILTGVAARLSMRIFKTVDI